MMVTKTFAQPRIVALLQPLIDQKIDSREKLLKKWTKDPKFLLGAVSMWVEERYRQYLQQMWPPVDEKKVRLDFLLHAKLIRRRFQ